MNGLQGFKMHLDEAFGTFYTQPPRMEAQFDMIRYAATNKMPLEVLFTPRLWSRFLIAIPVNNSV